MHLHPFHPSPEKQSNLSPTSAFILARPPTVRSGSPEPGDPTEAFADWF